MKTRLSHFFIWLVCCWTISGLAWADGYTKGLDAYRDGEYPKAYKILGGAVKKIKDKGEKAQAMALMGAAAAKMGKKAKAKSLFTKALKLDSEVSLSKDVIKDKSVRKLFAKVKKSDSGGDTELADESEDESSDEGGDEPKGEKGSSGGGSKSGSTDYRTFLPFGIGYYLKKQTTKAVLYGGIQAAGLLGYLFYSSEITKANNDATAIGEQAIADKANGKNPDQSTLDFLDQNEKFVKDAQRNQTVMLLLIAGGYGVSVVDSIYLSGGKSSKKSADVIENEPYELADHKLGDQETLSESLPLWNLNLHLVPLNDPAIMLSLKHNF